MKIDISLLFEKPELDSSVILIIQPLAPLSMVSDLPGSYYKTERMPTKFMICGLFENLLGWHFSVEDRKKVYKKMLATHKKRHNLILKKQESNVGYQPFVCYYFEMTSQIFFPVLLNYEDLWTQHLIGADERHAKGVINYDWRIENESNVIKEKIRNKELKDKDLGDFFKDNRAKFPLYYRSVPKREFVIAKGKYKFKLNINSKLLDLLKRACSDMNIGYLGTSEGWVDVSFQEVTNG